MFSPLASWLEKSRIASWLGLSTGSWWYGQSASGTAVMGRMPMASRCVAIRYTVVRIWLDLYQLLIIMFLMLFAVSLGQLISAISPSVQVAVLFNPVIGLMFNTFCGVTIPYPTLISFWRSWLYELSPYTRQISTMVSAELQYVIWVRWRVTYSPFVPVEPPLSAKTTNFTTSILQSDRHANNGLVISSKASVGIWITLRTPVLVSTARTLWAMNTLNHLTSNTINAGGTALFCSASLFSTLGLPCVSSS